MKSSAMAVSSSSSSPIQTEKKKKKKKNKENKCSKANTNNIEKEKTQTQSDGVAKQTRRNKSPGVRVVGARIYDSQNGKTCHQCRQKTMDFVASCKKNTDNNKQCTIQFCHRCLLNRYGEKAEEVAVLQDWMCPKCRGVCNCSFCMKKRGHLPTGLLAHKAKANGFSSVSEMLHMKDSDNSGSKQTTDDLIALDKDSAVSEAEKCGDEEGFQRPSNSKVEESPSEMDELKTRSNKLKRLRDNSDNENVPREIMDSDALTQESSHKRHQVSKETSEGKEKVCKRGHGGQLIGIESDLKDPEKDSQESINDHSESDMPKDVDINDTLAEHKTANRSHSFEKKMTVEVERNSVDVEIPLPLGIILNSVAAVDIPAEDVGHAFQFLEFCEVFKKVLKLKKGQSETILRELACGRSNRRLDGSAIVQFHIKLLSVIRKDSGKEHPCLKKSLNKNSWLQALIRYVSESHSLLKDLLVDCIEVGDYRYYQLDFSKKLQLLNFLCDEALGTTNFRSWIDEQNSKFIEREKKLKEKVLAEKQKNKKKLQDAMAKAVVKKNGARLSISEHADLVSKIKLEVAQTLAEASEPEVSTALRCMPICWDGKGRKFWSLRCYSGEVNIVVQDIEKGDSVSSKETWYTYDIEQKAAVEKYIASFRKQGK